MELFRLHAYSVVPQRTAEEQIPVVGGAIRVNADLRSIMESNLQAADFPRQPTVDFNVDETTRTNEVRDLVMAFAFGDGSPARAAALRLAERLAGAMDLRSSACLFVPVAYRAGTKRRVVLWIFPRDEAFQLHTGGPEGPTIELLKDIFSQTSRHRKSALFEGRELRTDFLQGWVLDLQAKSVNVNLDVASFWITRFLDCVPSMHDEVGSRLLAKAVRKAFERTDVPEQRQQLHAAAMAVRHSPNRRITLSTFANRYLDPDIRPMFLSGLPNDETRHALFTFDRQTFDSVLQFRVFELESGVFVSSPLDQIGESVKVHTGATTELTCQGIVRNEFLRARHG
ncbi:MAG TPA: hypothetical protein VF173_13595 [Thermoanaerobaculia bacterium]|nr:hypothetical protein [Thermoanaerobaculia bacterium]